MLLIFNFRMEKSNFHMEKMANDEDTKSPVYFWAQALETFFLCHALHKYLPATHGSIEYP